MEDLSMPNAIALALIVGAFILMLKKINDKEF